MQPIPTDTTIRPAVPADAEAIARMIHELAIYERAPEDCHATPEAVRERLFGPRPFAEALIVECRGNVAAFALFFHNFSTWECAPGLYLEDLFVRPAYRRRGIATLLLEHLAALAVARGCKRFEWAVLDWNKPARDFYHRLGARALDEWIPYRLEGPALEALARKSAPKEPRQLSLVELDGEEPAPKPRARKRAAAKAPQPEPVPEVAEPAPAEDTTPRRPVVIHTDGGAEPNPGTGGWAAILRSAGHKREICGGERETTNNRMELTAAIRALEALKEPCDVELYTDSQYVRNGITTWIKNWKKNGWRRGRGTGTGPVLNVDLWKELDSLCARHNVAWKWLKGHAGNPDNERADELCAEQIHMLRQASR